MSEEKRGMLSAGRPSNVRKAATLASLSDKGGTVRVNFDLDREEHKRLKLMAVEQGRTISEILRFSWKPELTSWLFIR